MKIIFLVRNLFNFRMVFNYSTTNDYRKDGVRKTIKVIALFNNELRVKK